MELYKIPTCDKKQEGYSNYFFYKKRGGLIKLFMIYFI